MRRWGLISLAIVSALAGCGSSRGKPVRASEETKDTSSQGSGAETKDADAGRQADWDGDWGSTFGVVQFKQSGRKVTGTYPGGTLECEAPGLDLHCQWADNTGAGRAKFHWDTTNKASGTYGNGDSDSDQGEWTLTWPAPSEGKVYSSASDSVISATLKNECSEDFSFCVETSNGAVQKSRVNKRSYTTYDVSPGAKVWARNGKGLNDGSCTTLLGTIEGSPGTKSTFLLCK